MKHSFFLDERSSKDIFKKMFQVWLDPRLSCAIAEEQLSRIISKWEVFFEQLSICLNYLLETFVSGHGALSRQKMDPKKRNGLVILFQVTQGRMRIDAASHAFCRRLHLLKKIRSNRPTSGAVSVVLYR